MDKACTKHARSPFAGPQVYTEHGLHPFLRPGDLEAWNETVKQVGWTRNTAQKLKEE